MFKITYSKTKGYSNKQFYVINYLHQFSTYKVPGEFYSICLT